MPILHQDELAELVLKRVRASGAEYGDIRILDSTTQTISGEDRRIDSIRDMQDKGFGIRVLYHGAWGFAASSVLSLEEAPRVADLAIEIAKGSASLAIDKVKLADEPVHRDRIVTARRIDPFAVPLEQKTALLLETMEYVHRQAGIVRSSASLWARRDHKLFVSTEGSRLEFDLLAVSGEYDATAIHDGRFASRT
ncbi:MAG: TldD/PmbA family protein, partial [Nitrospirae bacterium]|nr:TldD/PmbA family protein [Nitrospirota bacterium]